MQSGTPLFALQELAGWETERMARRYAHLAADHLAAYVGSVGLSDHSGPDIDGAVARSDEKQDSVFFDVVQCVQYPKLVSFPSLVWFERIERIDGRLKGSLYASVLEGWHVFGAICDREVDLVRPWRVVPVSLQTIWYAKWSRALTKFWITSPAMRESIWVWARRAPCNTQQPCPAQDYG